MPKVAIVTDSTCDVEPHLLAELGVEMVPLTVHFGDEHYRDWIDLRPAEFYAKLAASATLPTTSQPSPAAFSAAFERLAAQGADEIVVVTLASALSGTYHSAMLASDGSPVPVLSLIHI
jgi:DegV family protein with EDD domain